jgi:hypothetical protein
LVLRRRLLQHLLQLLLPLQQHGHGSGGALHGLLSHLLSCV